MTSNERSDTPGHKIWFITGASQGFGRLWAEAALARGDSVVALARNAAALDEVVAAHPETGLAIALDVTDRSAVVAAVDRAVDRFGRLDVVVNNAGYGHFGMVEEVTEDAARQQMEVNFFGALWVTQAVLPVMREQGGGHILATSSMGGIVTFPALGLYHASKWALEGLHDALAKEVAGLGVRITLIEPEGYATEWGRDSAVRSEESPAYAPLREAMAARRGTITQSDPADSVPAVFAVVDSDEPPLRLALGARGLGYMRDAYAERLATWAAWEDVTVAAGHHEP